MTSATYIRTGAMRHRGDLQARVTTPDGAGGREHEWITERKIWFQSRPLSGTEKLAGMRLQSSSSHELYTRFQDDVAPGVVEVKRIVHQGHAYQIEAAWSPQEHREYVHMIAARGVAT